MDFGGTGVGRGERTWMLSSSMMSNLTISSLPGCCWLSCCSFSAPSGLRQPAITLLNRNCLLYSGQTKFAGYFSGQSHLSCKRVHHCEQDCIDRYEHDSYIWVRNTQIRSNSSQQQSLRVDELSKFGKSVTLQRKCRLTIASFLQGVSGFYFQNRAASSHLQKWSTKVRIRCDAASLPERRAMLVIPAETLQKVRCMLVGL